MHSYSINNSKLRIQIISLIAIISVYIAFFLNSFILDYPIILQQISPIAVFGILFWLFNSFLWKLFNFNFLLNLPNFNGKWKGKFTSSYNNKDTEYPIKMEIKQSFTSIIVDANFNSSSSESFVANIDSSNPLRTKFVFSYLNKPNGDTVGTMTEHFGTAELFLNKNKNKMTGNYFTNRSPQTKGHIKIKR